MTPAAAQCCHHYHLCMPSSVASTQDSASKASRVFRGPFWHWEQSLLPPCHLRTISHSQIYLPGAYGASYLPAIAQGRPSVTTSPGKIYLFRTRQSTRFSSQPFYLGRCEWTLRLDFKPLYVLLIGQRVWARTIGEIEWEKEIYTTRCHGNSV